MHVLIVELTSRFASADRYFRLFDPCPNPPIICEPGRASAVGQTLADETEPSAI
jgi:hypothetical protein